MRQLLILLFCGLPGFALAQTTAAPGSGTNTDANAPVNVSAPALRPAQPAMHQSVPVQNHGQFYVKDDKPATPSGRIIKPAAPAAVSKEEWHRQNNGAATPGNSAVATEKDEKAKLKAGQEGAKKASSEPKNTRLAPVKGEKAGNTGTR